MVDVLLFFASKHPVLITSSFSENVKPKPIIMGSITAEHESEAKVKDAFARKQNFGPYCRYRKVNERSK